MAAVMCNKTAFAASAKAAKRPAVAARGAVVVRAQAEDLSRRSAMGMVAGTAALLAGAAPSSASFGDAANVFGKVTNKSGFVPFAGEGFALLIPSKWNPSAEKDFPGVVFRYEDNYFPVNNIIVMAQPTDKKSIDDFGGQDKFLEQYSYLLGKQAFSGETISEGGFAPNRVSAASLLDLSTSTDKKGKKYYKYELLVRTADGDEGGRHQLIGATVGSDGKLWIIKVQAGDKRWFKTTKKEAMTSFDSFVVA